MKKIIFSGMLILMFSFALLAQGGFEQPILNTSAGQSADVKLVKLLAQKKGLDMQTKVMAKVDDLSGIKSLVIVPGFSSKGLGAAGVSQEDELDRITSIVNKAKSRNIPIVMVHIGGNARRGGQSDGFCKLAAENSRHMIVVAQGNEDGFFSEIAKQKNIPIEIVEKISDAGDPLAALFSK